MCWLIVGNRLFEIFEIRKGGVLATFMDAAQGIFQTKEIHASSRPFNLLYDIWDSINQITYLTDITGYITYLDVVRFLRNWNPFSPLVMLFVYHIPQEPRNNLHQIVFKYLWRAFHAGPHSGLCKFCANSVLFDPKLASGKRSLMFHIDIVSLNCLLKIGKRFYWVG